MWDVDFQTAVAQAELEDREVTGAYHRLAFPGPTEASAVEIETTRPELLPPAWRWSRTPTTSRYHALFGTDVVTPGLRRAPCRSSRIRWPSRTRAPGIAMICTFGDTADVRVVARARPAAALGRSGATGASSRDARWLTGRGADAYADAGRQDVAAGPPRDGGAAAGARGALIGEPRPIEHEVKFYEKGDRPLEIVTSRQWYIRNGARDPSCATRCSPPAGSCAGTRTSCGSATSTGSRA